MKKIIFKSLVWNVRDTNRNIAAILEIRLICIAGLKCHSYQIVGQNNSWSCTGTVIQIFINQINIYFINLNWHQIEYIILWRYFEQSTVVEAVEIKNWGFACSNRSAVIYKFPISEYIVKSANSSTLNKIGLALNSDFCKGFRPKNSTKRLTQSDLLFRWPSFADIDSEWFSNCFEIPKVTYWHNNSPMSRI